MRVFTLAEIQKATDNFARERFLGRGGFGEVYKGFVEGGILGDEMTTVAVKRMTSTTPKGVEEFDKEIKLLSKLSHPRIVSLLGHCNHNHDDISSRNLSLVYEFMSGGTLAERLYNQRHKKKMSPPLTWAQRLKMCVGVAEGLNYLHTEVDPKRRVIHHDVKSLNILLDDNLEAKLSDFGLSRLTPENQSFFIGTQWYGTPGYIDPKYMKTGLLRKESDVYSFGVVLLEILSGRAAVDTTRPLGEQHLARWAKPFVHGGRTEDEILKVTDPDIVNQIQLESLREYLNLLNDCLDGDDKGQPPILNVLNVLNHLHLNAN